MMYSSFLSVLTLGAGVMAKTVTVDVGMGGIIFSPNSTTADVGDS
jgi:plastocyanin